MSETEALRAYQIAPGEKNAPIGHKSETEQNFAPFCSSPSLFRLMKVAHKGLLLMPSLSLTHKQCLLSYFRKSQKFSHKKLAIVLFN